MTLNKKSFIKLSKVILLLIVFIFFVRYFLPIKIEKKLVEIKDLSVQKIGVLKTYEHNQDITIFEKEIFDDYFINHSHGISFNEYKKIYSYNTKYDLYTVSLYVKNNSLNTIGLFYVESYSDNFIIVPRPINNEESVFIDPGDTYLIGIDVYVNREYMPYVDDEFISSQIDEICFSQIKDKRNSSIFAAEISSIFYKEYFTLKDK